MHKRLEAQDFANAVSDAQDRYSDAGDQLGAVTDFLIAQYRGCEFSFNRTVLEQPLDKARIALLVLCLISLNAPECVPHIAQLVMRPPTVNVSLQQATELPLAHVPHDVVEHALSYYRQHNMHLLADAALRLIQTVFADLPVSSKVPPPKAKVHFLPWDTSVPCSMDAPGACAYMSSLLQCLILAQD